MEQERFALNSGRKRPAYKPKDIHCPNCGAGLTVKDERSELVVCDYCGSHLDVSQEEKQVLGKGAEQKWDFPLNVGDSFWWKKARYEIIARMVFIEDDEDEMTRQYLLYNPYHGTLWLDEYDGHYSLSWDTHVMPTENAFRKTRGDILTTHDNQKWVMEEEGTYELVYVDGALPWIATIGDRVHYAEFVNKNTPKLQYDAQRIGSEIEYGRGQSLSMEQVRRALGQAEFAEDREPESPLENVAETRQTFTRLVAAVIFILVVNVALFIYTYQSGTLVLEQAFSARELTNETLSKPFRLENDGDIVRVSAYSPVNNAWMALDVGVVMNEDTLVHLAEADVARYYGSEGSQRKSIHFKLPWAGTYRLLVHAVSARGTARSAKQAEHNATIKVYTGVFRSYYFLAISIVAGLVLVLLIIVHRIMTAYHFMKSVS